MITSATKIFDQYDDTEGVILKSFLSEDKIPDFIKTATRIDPTNTEDDNFALILISDKHKLKKYATVDKGNTALSVLYFLNTDHNLPKEAIKIASTNLIAACIKHGLVIPEQLKEAALEINTEDNAQISENPDPVPSDFMHRTNYNSISGSNFLSIPPFPPKEKLKPETSPLSKEASVQYVTREKIERELPYFDISDWLPENSVENVSPQRTISNNKYPLDSYTQVKEASKYYRNNYHLMHPRERHDFCVKLAARLDELGMPLAPEMERYSYNSYAFDADDLLKIRKSVTNPEHHDAIDFLLEKRAYVSPETFAEAVADFDNITGLNWYWGTSVPDPWYTTFGPSMEKMASKEWRFDEVNIHITEQDLKDLAYKNPNRVKSQFGDGFLTEFVKNPKAVFESLPKTPKIILAKMAMDKDAP